MTPSAPAIPAKGKHVPLLWLALTALQTGVLSGLAALAYFMLDGVLRGDSPWIFPNLLSGTFYPRRALSVLFTQATLSGVALHVLVSGLSGLVFAILLVRYLRRPIRALWLGALMGIVWWYVIFRFFWASVNPAVVIHQPMPGTPLGYMVFGFCMGLYPLFVRHLALTEDGESQAPSPG